MKELSILIPSRSEMFLAKTVEDILANIEADTEIIVVLDGAWAEPPIPQNDRVNVIYLAKSIGQRAATNLACKLSRAKYVMKVDAHCSFDKGFDRKMIEAFKVVGDNVTMVPVMRNLWAFDWKCYHCGWKKYQGPTPEKCDQCGKTDRLRRKMIWIGKRNPQSTSYCFDSTPHFQYFEDWKHRPQYEKDKIETGLTETMSLQGSCWMLTREKYWELGVCDERFGSWGSQGIEVAAKTWLSGGRVLANHKTWYAHMFRTQGKDFGFPYPIAHRDQEAAKKYAKDLFFNNKWPLQKRPLSWLVEKFWPVKGWTDEDLAQLKANTFTFQNEQTSDIKSEEVEPTVEPTTEPTTLPETQVMQPTPSLTPSEQKIMPTKSIIYYTDNQLPESIALPVRKQLQQISAQLNIPIASVTLQKQDFGEETTNFPPSEPGRLALYKQILSALEQSRSDIVFFAEHDVLYHPSHFDFTPTDTNTFYYNQNLWFLRLADAHALHYEVNLISGLCGYREALYTHFKERYERILAEGLTKKLMSEPRMYDKVNWKYLFHVENWKSRICNINVVHLANAANIRWNKSQFRNQKLLKGWKKSKTKIYGWGKTHDLVAKFT